MPDRFKWETGDGAVEVFVTWALLFAVSVFVGNIVRFVVSSF